MAITSYAELQTAVGDWLDDASLTSYLPDFVMLAEAHLNRDLRHRKMVTTTDLSPTSNVYTLPDDYLHYVRVVEKVSPRRDLELISPQAADQLYAHRVAGPANHFTIVGDSLTAFPLSANDIELTYRQKIPALSASNTTNWLLDASPGLYLRAAQLMALHFKNELDTPRYAETARIANKLVEDLNEESMLGERYKAGVTVRGVTP